MVRYSGDKNGVWKEIHVGCIVHIIGDELYVGAGHLLEGRGGCSGITGFRPSSFFIYTPVNERPLSADTLAVDASQEFTACRRG